MLMKKADGEERTSIVVTSLNLLGKPMEDDTRKSEITTIALSRETAKTSLFKVQTYLTIINGSYLHDIRKLRQGSIT